MRADVVDERVHHVTRGRSICGRLDCDRDGIGHDEDEKHADAEIKRLAYLAHQRRLSHKRNLQGQSSHRNCPLPSALTGQGPSAATRASCQTQGPRRISFGAGWMQCDDTACARANRQSLTKVNDAF